VASKRSSPRLATWAVGVLAGAALPSIEAAQAASEPAPGANDVAPALAAPTLSPPQPAQDQPDAARSRLRRAADSASRPAEPEVPSESTGAERSPVQDSAPPLPDRPPVAADRCPPEPTSSEPRRRSPSITRTRGATAECNPLALPEPATDSQPDIEGIPDRWRVVSMLGAQRDLLDPYHGNNVLKADEPALKTGS